MRAVAGGMVEESRGIVAGVRLCVLMCCVIEFSVWFAFSNESVVCRSSASRMCGGG